MPQFIRMIPVLFVFGIALLSFANRSFFVVLDILNRVFSYKLYIGILEALFLGVAAALVAYGAYLFF